MSDESSDALCLSCGLCCDGSLFDRFELDADELAWAERRRLPLVGPARRTLQQPCPCFSGSCTAYDERPRVCRRFRCALLASVAEGSTSIDEARERVRAFRARIADLRARIDASPELGTWPTVEAFVRAAEAEEISRTPAVVDLLLDVGVIRAQAERDFSRARGDKDERPDAGDPASVARKQDDQ